MGREARPHRVRRRHRSAYPPCRRRRRPHLHRGQRRGRPRLRLRRRDRRRLVPDHPLDLAGGSRSASTASATASTRPPARTATPSSRPRTNWPRSASSSARLERRPRLHRHRRPGHLADAGVHRPRLFRRDSRRDLRRPARRPVDRHADPHPAVRPADLRLRLAWRHQARAALPRGPARVLRVRRPLLRSRRPAADADLRHARPRHRHERVAVRAARLGRQAAATTAARC